MTNTTSPTVVLINGTRQEWARVSLSRNLNTASAKIPCVFTFAQAVKHYRENVAPRMLRPSTFSVADRHLKKHPEPDWNEVPAEHINIDKVNDWIWEKRQEVFRGSQ